MEDQQQKVPVHERVIEIGGQVISPMGVFVPPTHLGTGSPTDDVKRHAAARTAMIACRRLGSHNGSWRAFSEDQFWRSREPDLRIDWLKLLISNRWIELVPGTDPQLYFVTTTFVETWQAK